MNCTFRIAWSKTQLLVTPACAWSPYIFRDANRTSVSPVGEQCKNMFINV